jgi:hypothetical protein
LTCTKWALPDSGFLTQANNPAVQPCDTDGYPLCSRFGVQGGSGLHIRVGIVPGAGPLPDGGAVIHFQSNTLATPCPDEICLGGCNGAGDAAMP